MAETKEEYNERTKAVEDFVKRNMTTDTDATKKSGISLKTPLGGIGDKILDTVRTNVSLGRPLGGLGEKAMEAMFPYGAEGRFPQQERAVKAGMTASGQPIGPDMQERLRTGVGPDVTKKSIEEEAATAVPVAATPSVEAPLPAGSTGPWSQGKRNEYLGLNEGKIVKGGGPGGTDLLTNREQPFTQPKELPQEAYGIGGSKEKEAMMADYEKEMRTPYASVEKIKAMERRLGIGKEISPFEEKRLSLEEKKIAQDADQFAKTHDMKSRQNQEQLAMTMGGFTETEVPDPAGTGTIKVRTPNPEFFKEAFDEEGNFDLKNAMKSIENSRVFQSAKAKLGADPKNATVIKERLKAAGYSDAEIKKRLGI